MATPAKEISAQWHFEVPFYDVDSLGIVWHGHYCKYFERARCALLGELKFDYTRMAAEGYAVPVVDLNVRYLKPLRFQQQVLVRARLKEWEVRLEIDYVIEDANTGECLTRATTVQAVVDISTGALQLQAPAALRELIAARL